MLSSLLLEGVAHRFEPFVAEVRSFLKQNNVAYGFPEHLLAFTQKLSSEPELRQGVSVKLLEVLRESETPVSPGELVELLLVTIGGANIDEDTPAVQKAERVLSQLVGEVMTSQDGALSLEQVSTESPSVNRPEDTEPLSTVDAEVSELPVASKHPPAEAVAWAPAPSYVWAAILCGVLLPPCMYLLSRPHGAPSTAPRTTNTSSVHSAPHPDAALDLVLPSPEAMKPLDLDLGEDEPAPRPRMHRSLSHPPTIAPAKTQPTQDPSSSAAAQANTASSPGVENTVRETDMPGRDLGLPASPAQGPQEL